MHDVCSQRPAASTTAPRYIQDLHKRDVWEMPSIRNVTISIFTLDTRTVLTRPNWAPQHSHTRVPHRRTPEDSCSAPLNEKYNGFAIFQAAHISTQNLCTAFEMNRNSFSHSEFGSTTTRSRIGITGNSSIWNWFICDMFTWSGQKQPKQWHEVTCSTLPFSFLVISKCDVLMGWKPRLKLEAEHTSFLVWDSALFDPFQSPIQ